MTPLPVGAVLLILSSPPVAVPLSSFEACAGNKQVLQEKGVNCECLPDWIMVPEGEELTEPTIP